ncbi:MAG: FAD-binding protein [Rhodanobacteraceae bacterium]|nr:MAG: FAD-binding protein [Rhodanobacteraceae bacterium]
MKSAQPSIVVIGSGVAGMATALSAAPANVCLICPTHDGSGSASALAQGGVAAAVGADDSAAAHARDTLEAGAWHNAAAAVGWLTGAARPAVAWLEQHGVRFDRDGEGNLQLGREGGHACNRIVHAGGDATGAALVRALQECCHGAAHVQWRGSREAVALLLRDGHVVGVRTRDADGRDESLEAAAVVLATGGIGALYAHTSNPAGAGGSGLSLALAAGAELRDLEFVQFHPTALASGGQHLPLLTEALRGAGARLIDAEDRPLMAGLHPLGDLAPRDVVARRVWQVQHAGGAAWLDARAITGDWNRRFPTVLAACHAHGLDPRQTPLPITPVAHFHMGGVATDLDGRTSVPGLFAVGEVACNGVHGANRLASNSLLEAVACGRRLGRMLAGAGTTPGSARGTHRWAERGPALATDALPSLRELLWRVAGPVREMSELHAAWHRCNDAAAAGWQMRVATALLRAACRRRQSLGAHYLQGAPA